MAATGNPYSFYLDILSQWSTNVALQELWYIYFNLSSVGALKGDLGAAVRAYDSGDPNQWKIDNAVVSNLVKSEYQMSTENLVGCVFAHEITLPGEKINASNEGVNYGAYLGPATSSTREPYSPLDVVFYESNASFLDFVIRPWTLLVGYNGLVARQPGSAKNVKCDYAYAALLAKTGAGSPLAIRKAFTFNNICPITAPDLTQSYADSGKMEKSVSFVYDSYSVMSKDSGLFINQ